MRSHTSIIVASFGLFLLFFVAFLSYGGSFIPETMRTVPSKFMAAIYGVVSITAADMRGTYRTASLAVCSDAHTEACSASEAQKKVKILIVPGHEPDSGGTMFQEIYERDLAVVIADTLATFLSQNPRYSVTVARTKTAWNPTLLSYFETHADAIAAFRAAQMKLTNDLILKGKLTVDPNQIDHNTAPQLAALHLYGINTWASDNTVSLTIHIHLNDYAGRSRNTGDYSGYAIYVPDKQYSNAAASKEVAETIARRLAAYHTPSSLPGESAGVIEDQQLIAIGSNNSADNASILIEYGYIYEPEITTATVQKLALADFAYATYLGLQDFFTDPPPWTYGSVALPYQWGSDTHLEQGAVGKDVYALQSALHYLGAYPPASRAFSDCPITGTFGPCTKEALTMYQAANHIRASGIFDAATRAVLESAVH